MKFDERATRAIHIGNTTTGYLLWHPTSGKLLKSRHVKFNEKLVYGDLLYDPQETLRSKELKMKKYKENVDCLKTFEKGDELQTENTLVQQCEKFEETIFQKRGRPRTILRRKSN